VDQPSRILVTGAAGFVGRHMLHELRGAFPAAVLIAGVHREPAQGWDGEVPMDLTRPDSLLRALHDAAPDHIVHLGAQANVAESFRDAHATWDANLNGTLSLALAVRDTSPSTRLLCVSTGEVYGLSFQSGLPLDEDAPLAPANPYAAAKAAADNGLARMAEAGLHVLRARPLNHVGPGQSDRYAVANFARHVARIGAGLQPPVIEVGALDRWRDFLDVRDVCAAYALMLRHWDALPNGAALNIASGQARRVGDVLEELIARAGITVRIEEAAGALRPMDLLRSVGDASRARALLGWAPRIPWEKTLDDILADWRDRVRSSPA